MSYTRILLQQLIGLYLSFLNMSVAGHQVVHIYFTKFTCKMDGQYQ